jgi:hypothetical protein
MRRGWWIALIFVLSWGPARSGLSVSSPQAAASSSIGLIARLSGPSTRAVAAAGSVLYAGMDRKVVAVDVADPARPTVLGESMELAGAITGLAVGPIVYATAGDAGLYLLDFQPPASPRILGFVDTPGWAYRVAASGSYAYVADGSAGLRIIDARNPSNPQEAGAYDTPGIAYSVVVSGSYAYLADGPGGVRVLDISDPSAPREVAAISTPQPARDLALIGSRLAVALGWEGWGDPLPEQPDLLLLELSVPSSPQVVARLRTAGSGRAVAAEGPWIYLGTWEGVQAVRATSQASLMEWGRRTIGTVADLAAGSGYLYAAISGGATGVAILRIGEWGDSPVLTPIGQFGGRAWRVVHQGSQIYLAVRPFKVWRVDGSDPTRLRETGQRLLSGTVWDLLLSGDRLYVAAGRAGLRILDAADPSLREVGGIDTPGEAVGLAAMDRSILVADGPGGLLVIDPEDPQRPREVTRWPPETGTDIRAVVVSGTLAYMLVGSETVQVLDLSSPSAPRPRGAYTVWGWRARSLFLSGNYLYVTAGSTLWILDVSDPDRLRSVGSIAPGYSDLWDVKVIGDRAYVAGGGLHVLDVSSPFSPRLLGTFSTEAYGIDLAGALVYVAAGEALRVIQIIDPSSMTELGRLGMPEIARYDSAMDVDQGILYIASGDQIIIVDARDSDHPRRLGEYHPDWSRCSSSLSPMPSISPVIVDRGLTFFTSACFFKSEARRFEVVEVSDPGEPLPADSTPIDAYAEHLRTRLPFVYMTDGEDLWVVNLLGASIEKNRFATPGKAAGLEIFGSRLYVADGMGGLRILDISNPVEPVEIGAYLWPSGEAKVVLTNDRYAYVLLWRTDGENRWDLRVLDLADPRAPRERAVYPLPEGIGSERGLALAGGYMFVGGSYAGDRMLRVLDVQDPASLREVEAWPDLPAVAMVWEGDRLYVLSWEGYLTVFRLPPSPMPSPSGPYRVYLPMIARSDPIDFTVAQVNVLQGTAVSPPYSVFIAGRPTVVQAIPVIQGALYRRVTGRLICYRGDSPIASMDLQTVARSSVKAPAFGEHTGSLRFLAPEGCREPGSTFIVELDPENRVPEVNEENNRSPVSGRHAPDFRTARPLRVMIVPVRYRGTLPPGAEDLSGLDYLTWYPVRVFPVPSVEYSLHSPVDFEDGGCSGSDCWRSLLDLITAIHDQEPQGAGMIYYGLVDAVWGMIAGVGWLGRPTSVGWAGWPGDRQPASITAAHEMGHNFNRLHAPGCGAGQVDPGFPPAYIDSNGRATIGVWGLDLWEMRWKSPREYFDLMSYCYPRWISDYTYRAIFDFREGVGFAPPVVGGWEETLYLRGWVDPQGRVSLKPAYTMKAPLDAEDSGSFRAELFDADGRLLAARRFSPVALPDDPEGWQGFALHMPAAPGTAAVRIWHGDRLVVERRSEGPMPSASSARLRRESSGVMAVLADPQPGIWYRLRISRDGGRTWEVVAVDRANLRVALGRPDCEMLIEVQASDGLRTDTRTFAGCEAPLP